jgi:hypothetical protein
MSSPVNETLCTPAVVAGAAAETLVLSGPEPLSPTLAVSWFPVEPTAKVGAGTGHVTVGAVWSILKLADTGVSLLPAPSSLAA